MVPADRWEQGSDFHLIDEIGASVYPWHGQPHTLWGSGRDALRSLFAWGRTVRGWRRVWVPSYYCPEVLPPLRAAGAELLSYQDDPTRAWPTGPRLTAGDVLVRVSYFGLRRWPESPARAGVAVIADLTHDPFAPFEADYGFASLRKTLPLPDGGVLWSPRNNPMPPPAGLGIEHAAAALDRLSAMVLKARYLRGDAVNRESYRALAIEGERRIAGASASGISPLSASLLGTFPTQRWQERRRQNFELLRGAFAPRAGVRLLEPEDGATAFAATYLFDSPQRREQARAKLISARIFPAVLWPLEAREDVRPSDVELSSRLLTVCCDFRYGAMDMERVADRLREAVQA